MMTWGYVWRAILVLFLFAGVGAFLISAGMKEESSYTNKPLMPRGCVISLGFALIIPLIAYLILLWRAGWF